MLENSLSFDGSGEIFWDLSTIPDEHLGANWYNKGEGKEGSFFFIFSRKSINKQILFSLLLNDLIIISK